MSKKLVYITDLHFREVAPTTRLDKDFLGTQLDKLDAVFQYCEKQDCDTLLCGGDIGHAWKWSSPMLSRVSSCIQRYPHIKMVSTIGNHDLCGGNHNLLASTGIHILSRITNNFILLNEDSTFVLDNIRVISYPHNSSKTTELLAGKAGPALDKTFLNIGLVHAPVGQESFQDFQIAARSLNISKDTLDIALFGDIHTGFDVTQSTGGAILANPGAMTRLSRSEINRTPSLALIDISTDSINISYKGIDCQPSSEVFNYTTIAKTEQELGYQYLASLEETKTSLDVDPIEKIKNIGKKCKYSLSAIERLVNEL